MRIGILKETHFEDNRIALTPAGIQSLVEKGHSVFVEKDAGLQSNFTNNEFESVGAKLVYSQEEAVNRSELILKVSPFSDEEALKLNPEQIIFSALHLFMRRKLVDIFLEKKITSIGFELVENKEGHLPILGAMSEIAGQMSIQIAARYLENNFEISRGVLLGGIAGVAPAAVVILGAGTVGINASRAAIGLGAQVVILDKDIHKLKQVEELLGKHITTVVMNQYTVERGVKFADVLIGAVLIKGEKAPHVVTESMVKSMKPGAVIIDVSIDQGGCIETSRPTTLTNPVYIMHDVIHYCVPNIPALVARTASYGLNNIVVDYVQQIADLGIEEAMKSNAGLTSGVCTHNGSCTNETLAEIFNLEYRRIHIFSKN
ncbi:MAG: alanine dehydrogenase [Ignavibacteria bacterium]|nr:alanine dehydrogenase [Ignavibacteria bacterium]